MKKLIVDTSDARKIRDAQEEFTLIRVLRKPEDGDLAARARASYPNGALFWVAEPLCHLAGSDSDSVTLPYWYAADQTPNGFRRATSPSAGGRSDRRQARHAVEVVRAVSVRHDKYSRQFWANVIFKRVEL